MFTSKQIKSLDSAGFALVELEEGSQGPSQHVKNPSPAGTVLQPRTSGQYQPTGARDGFDCRPTRTGVNALSSIPRDAVTIVAPVALSVSGPNGSAPFEVPTEGGDVSVGLDSVVGMYLCEMEADYTIVTDPATPPTPEAVAMYVDTLMRSATITLKFRGEQVANLRNLRLGELVWSPECCGTNFGACIGSILPDYGVLEVEYSLPTPPAGILDVIISVSVEANGCGCTCGKGSCGC